MADPSLWPPLIASFAAVVLGGVSGYFRPFIESRADVRKRVRLRRQALVEQLALKHATLLEHARSVTEDQVLRGDGKQEPDLVGEFAQETFRLLAIFHRLNTLQLAAAAGHLLLWITTAAAVVGLFTAWLVVGARGIVLVSALAMAALQIVVVSTLFWASWKLELYEDIT